MLGNGFDLAHELPTKYIDFLEWVKAEYSLYVILRDKEADIVNKANQIGVDWAIITYPSRITVEITENESLQLEIWECIDENTWIDYFLNNSIYQKDNWIDFESEIALLIKSIETDRQDYDFYGQIEKLSNEFLESKFLYKGFESLLVDENGVRGGKQKITYIELRDILLADLKRLIRALEIYLTNYVQQIECKCLSPDFEARIFDKVISFNYTNTYQKIYDADENCEYDYIHGKADIDRDIETNNMVLGIDEYLQDNKKNIDIEFITFKKFFQRIHKETGCKYKVWLDDIKKDYVKYLRKQEVAENRQEIFIGDSIGEIVSSIATSILKDKKCQMHNLSIMGHSLDITDKDILRDLILNDNVYTTIYYLNKDIMGQQIANLVKVIGQDELIKRTGGSTKTIEFKQQAKMVVA